MQSLRWSVITAGVSALVYGQMAVGQEEEPLIETTPQTKAERQVQPPGAPMTVVFGDPGQKPEAALERAEDMEVLRQLLRDAVRREYAEDQLSIVGLRGEDRAEISKEHILPDLIGPLAGHVPEYGLVYQLQAPPLYEPPEKKQPEPAEERKSLSEWELMRRQLRGEEVDSTATGEAALQFARLELVPAQRAPTKDELISRLLDVLAENGHHVRHLDDEERIAVAVTLRPVEPEAARPTDAEAEGYSGPGGSGQGFSEDEDGAPAGGYGMAGGESGSSYSAGALGRGGSGDYGATGPDDETGSYGGGYSGRSEQKGGYGDNFSRRSEQKSEHEVQGDLHLRQGNYARAIGAYELALKKLIGRAPYVSRVGEKPSLAIADQYDPENPAQVRLYRKLVQAWVGRGSLDAAGQLINQLNEAGARAEQDNIKPPAKTTKEGKTKHIPLAARLTVSATKADCDAVAAGEIDQKEFARRAEVRFLDPEALRKAVAPQKEAAGTTDESPAEEQN